MRKLASHSLSSVYVALLASVAYLINYVEARKVTDLEIIESPYGVPVDLLYNETSSSGFGRLNSVPGCPKSIDGYPWVYYGHPPRCYLTGYRGPCPEGRLLFVEFGSKYGICGCECFQYVSTKEGMSSPDGRFRFCNVSSKQVQDTEDKICYNLQERGPCNKRQWLVRDPTGHSVICVQECPKGPQGPLHYDNRIGACVYHESSNGSTGGSSGSPPPNVCPQGRDIKFTYSSVLKRCIPVKTNPGDYVFIG